MPADEAFLGSLTMRPIGSDIDLSEFDCDSGQGEPQGGINWYLKERALEMHNKRLSTATCWLFNGKIVGYMTTTMATVILESPHKQQQGLDGQKLIQGGPDISRFPSMLIGMLGVDKNHRRKGLGGIMIQEAVASAMEVAPRVGCRFVHVDSLRTEEAMGLYQSAGFVLIDEPAPKGRGRSKPWMFLDLRER